MDPKNKPHQNISIAVAIALFPLFLYVLLLGPAVRLHPDCPKGVQKAIETIYAPLEWLHDHSPLSRPLDAYVKLWRK